MPLGMNVAGMTPLMLVPQRSAMEPRSVHRITAPTRKPTAGPPLVSVVRLPGMTVGPHLVSVVRLLGMTAGHPVMLPGEPLLAPSARLMLPESTSRLSPTNPSRLLQLRPTLERVWSSRTSDSDNASLTQSASKVPLPPLPFKQ